jgi:exosortase K
VGWLRGETLALVPGLGWAPPGGSYVIAPACAGVNFLIVAFAVAALGFVPRLGSAPRRLAGWLAALAGGYALTIAVNTLRIAVAVPLYRLDLAAAGLPPERLHRLWGSALYLAALWGLWLALEALTAPGSERERRLAAGAGHTDRHGRDGSDGRASRAGAWLVPGLYLGMTVLVPLANGAWRHAGGAFAEHAIMVGAITAAAGAAFLGLRRHRAAARRGSEAWTDR